MLSTIFQTYQKFHQWREDFQPFLLILIFWYVLVNNWCFSYRFEQNNFVFTMKALMLSKTKSTPSFSTQGAKFLNSRSCEPKQPLQMLYLYDLWICTSLDLINGCSSLYLNEAWTSCNSSFLFPCKFNYFNWHLQLLELLVVFMHLARSKRSLTCNACFFFFERL